MGLCEGQSPPPNGDWFMGTKLLQGYFRDKNGSSLICNANYNKPAFLQMAFPIFIGTVIS